jgi:rifampicin phosphotransferase
MTTIILDAATPEALDGRAGGKATSLFRLQSMGLPIPDFFCIPREAFAAFTALRAESLEALLARLPATADVDLPELSGAIQALLAEVPLPDDLTRELDARLSPVALESFSVRSSALQEDSRAHSFAGLFKTSLFVRARDVPSQVVRCWLSAFEPGVLGYCRRNGMNPLEIEVAVIVQQMVRSRVSGVMFTADPAGALSEVLIVAGLGLGEGIVADLVETDTYRYDRITKTVRSEVVQKRACVALDEARGSGTRLDAVPDDVASAPALDEGLVRQLVDAGLRAEAGLAE